ncbi:hypothetical protein NQ318_017749 [Aromia moschata]|uniref:Uncharacterized protein n=1 Tax=Aromia moschata TaxID=1265417 RepID=A0AAV8Y8B9_9CUCU|nr:hypothetical protein NQ318_017749 [Aromia moschata]
MLPNIPLPPEQDATRWSSWLEAVAYYDEYFECVERVICRLDSPEINDIKKAQDLLRQRSVRDDFRYIINNYGILIDVMRRFEIQGLSLSEQFTMLEDVMRSINDVRPNSVSVVIKEDMLRAFQANPGHSTLESIWQFQNGTIGKLPPDVLKYSTCIDKFSHCPISIVEAWRIAHRAIKCCFDDLDGFEKPPFPIDRVWSLVKEHFKIKTQADILDSFYKNFDKAYIASLCKKLVQLAREDDELSQSIFTEAGTYLARNISAVVVKAAPELTDRDGGIHILCVGSVWLSWDLLRSGFIKWMENNTSIDKMSLMKLNTEMGVGAALMASDRLHLPLERDYSKNYTVFYRYKRGVCCANNGTV